MLDVNSGECALFMHSKLVSLPKATKGYLSCRKKYCIFLASRKQQYIRGAFTNNLNDMNIRRFDVWNGRWNKISFFHLPTPHQCEGEWFLRQGQPQLINKEKIEDVTIGSCNLLIDSILGFLITVNSRSS